MMRFTALFGVVVLAACQPAAQSPSVSTSPAPMAARASSGSMAATLSQLRADQGLGPVVENTRLSRAAAAHAQDMVALNYFSHTGFEGSSFTDRARAAGYDCAAAENIAYGQDTQGEVVVGWMNSPGHRRNILLADATEIGVGRVGTMWVLMMGRGC
ncbi:CAP domain-containing protein [Octadecabacter sp. CECT 8868]|uniref:CAP domain-containing protein n=1 Tax=Octadecabacter algicola TaxID=2909342 RepID=UPI001F435C53|nr:CAP domain-containing protein [Octadecabacter algicola]MCF2904557.1 CAP domain-containing protein [Octadecabacter algicola]